VADCRKVGWRIVEKSVQPLLQGHIVEVDYCRWQAGAGNYVMESCIGIKDHGVPIGHSEAETFAVLEKTPSELRNVPDLQMGIPVKEVKEVEKNVFERKT
jgi:hypothetical protein